jgi:hypothetical protein
MAEAAITLKLTPAEFDLLRKAIGDAASSDYEITRNNEAPANVRNAARREHAQLHDLLAKLR